MGTPNRWLRSTTVWTSPAITDRQLKILVFVVLTAPLAMLAWDMLGELNQPGSRLGGDPGKAIVLTLGDWAIRILLLGLCISTARRLFSLPRLTRVRRLVGLLAFTYICLHFLAYLTFLAGFDWQVIGEDIGERPYITVGFTGLLLLVPLAITSTNGWRRRLGRRWVVLHRAVYAAFGLALVHLFWLTKDGFAEFALYLALFVLLMAERGLRRWQSVQRSLPPVP